MQQTSERDDKGDESRPTIYIAGPDVFLVNALEVGAAKKALCRDFGFRGLFPFDNEADEGPDQDARIFAGNMAFIAAADIGIFNLTPFRGVSADVGTVFELGAMYALGKPVFAYTNDTADLFERVDKLPQSADDARLKRWRDRLGMTIESYGNADNLMITAALAAQGHALHRIAVDAVQRFTDLRGFVACLAEARAARPPKNPEEPCDRPVSM